MQWRVFKAPVLLLLLAGCAGQKDLQKNLSFILLTTDGSGTTLVASSDEIKYVNSPLSYVFNSAARGRATCIDLFDPMKPMVYYAGQKKIIILDNTLSVQNEIDLIKAGQENAGLVCRSFSGHYWLYDDNLNELIRCDALFKPVARTGNLGMFYKVNTISKIKEFDNALFALVPGKGIYVFDLFAGYVRFLPFPGIVSFDVWADRIVMVDNFSHISGLTLSGFKEISYPQITLLGVSDIAILKDGLALGTDVGIMFWPEK